MANEQNPQKPQLPAEEVSTQELPEATIELLNDEGFRLQLERLSDDALYDQGSVTFGGQGCASTPSGPSC